jgi:DNA-binding transcriptional regulator GbsR (MarR family)
MMFAHHAGRKQKVVMPNVAIVKKVVQQVVKQKVRRQVKNDVKKDIRKITKAAPVLKNNKHKGKK